MKLIKVEEDTHKAFKMYCVANGIDMTSKATEILNEFLLKEAGGIE